jgi:hydroxypyruvate reductase
MSGVAETPRALLAALLAGAAAHDAAGALAVAADRARARACVVLTLGLQPAAEARELAALHAAIVQQSLRHGRPMAPTVLLSAGPVFAQGVAAGGAEFLLALGLALDDNRAVYAGACGPAPQGAFLLGPDTVPRAAAAGLAPAAQLHGGRATALFAALGETMAQAPPPAFTLRAVLVTQE